MPEYLSRKRPLLCLAIIAAFIWIWALWPSQAPLSVTFLDVRQGDCALIRTPAGGSILIDAGSRGRSAGGYDNGSRTVAPFLRSQGVRQLDLLVMTHPHEDHIGGVPGLLATTKVDAVMDAGVPHPSKVYEETLKLIEQRSIKYVKARRGQKITFPGGVVIDVLNPAAAETDVGEGNSETSVNNQSVVLRLSYENVSFLFAADAEREAEDDMLADCSNLHSTALKVGHHGATSSTSDLWLQSVEPQIAVISVGKTNRFGHPSEETLERLAGCGAQVFRTDNHGAITITTDGDTLNVSTIKR